MTSDFRAPSQTGEIPLQIVPVALAVRIQGDDHAGHLQPQWHVHGSLRGDHEHSGRQHRGQAERVLARRRDRLVQPVDDQDDRFPRAQRVACGCGLLQHLL